jgi:hypothetical protein
MRAKALVVLALSALLIPLAALPAPAGGGGLCFGQIPTIYATAGVDTIGTAGNDVILGTAGPDTIFGNAGRDTICGEGGDDTLWGGPGRDRIDGGDGGDIIISGGGQNQVLLGGDGNDTIRSAGDDTRSYGGPGSDTLTGKMYGNFQELYGGSGNDRLYARTGNLDAHGGVGNDILRSYSAFVSLYGEDGDDRIFSGYRNGLDAGPGFDRCSLDMDVPNTGCEKVSLLCGTGGEPLPGEPPDGLSTAYGDFDGNGMEDTLYAWFDGADWIAHIETDGGFGAEAVLPTAAAFPAEAIGGHDIDGDGIDEAFLQIDSGVSTTVVGIYTLWEVVGSPVTGFSCGMVPVMYAEAPAAQTSFIIGGTVTHANGLQCRPSTDTLREYVQESVDGFNWTQHRYDYQYLAGFGVTAPVVHQFDSSVVSLSSPADDAQIGLGYSLTCGGLVYP